MGFYTKVVGVTFDGRQKYVLQTQVNDTMTLQRDKYNTYDSNAIKVINMQGNQIGFLPKEVSQKLAPLMDAGAEYTASVTNIIGANSEGWNVGVNIYIEQKTTSEPHTTLIKCKECGGRISIKADFCPHCGYSENTNVINPFNSKIETTMEYEEGCYKIGIDMPEGEYQLFCIYDNRLGYYQISSDANGKDIISNENFKRNSYIEVQKNQFLRLNNCKAISTNNQNQIINTPLNLKENTSSIINAESNNTDYNKDDFVIEETILIKYNGQNTTVTIPPGVTKIAEKSFYRCKTITNLFMPNTVVSIGRMAFYSCENLTKIVFSEEITDIDDNAFANTGLIDVILPQKITTISNKLFSHCSKLTNIIFPDDITEIGDKAFHKCPNLTNVILPKKVTYIGEDAFEREVLSKTVIPSDVTIVYNKFLQDDFVIEGTTLIKYTGHNDTVTIPQNITEIGENAFCGCVTITNIIVPNNISIIGKAAFKDCKNLMNIELPDTVKNIGIDAFYNTGCYNDRTFWDDNGFYINKHLIKCTEETTGVFNVKSDTKIISSYAFYHCKKITEVVLPDSVKAIGKSAFEECLNLTKIYIPDTLDYLGANAFKKCENLTEINIPHGITSIKAWTFAACISLTTITIPSNIISIDACAFAVCQNLNNIELPQNIKSIGESAFTCCHKLYEVMLPDDITDIGKNAFKKCTNLTKVVLPKYISHISEGTFSNCINLTHIIIPENVSSIRASAFNECRELVDIIIPAKVNYIGPFAFYKCNKLNHIRINNRNVNIAQNAFCNTGYYNDESKWENRVLYIDGHLIKASRNLLGEYTIKTGTTSIASFAFEDCYDLKKLIVPNTVSYMGKNILYGCKNLSELTIPFEKDTFLGCFWGASYCWENKDYVPHSLKRVVVLSTNKIAMSAFEYCSCLTSIALPDKLTEIKSYAFANCINLTSVNIPSTVTKWGTCVFKNCKNLDIKDFNYPGDCENETDYEQDYERDYEQDYEPYEYCSYDEFEPPDDESGYDSIADYYEYYYDDDYN